MTLLIVDDEIYAIQGLLEDINQEWIGLDKILTANCYTQALNVFLENRIDILLCDIEMPFGSGLELVEWVKKQSPETVCIFLTCHDEFSFANRAIKLQCFDYILKPVSAEVVNDVLKRGIEKIREKDKEQVYREYGKIYFENISGTEQAEIEAGSDAVEKIEKFITLHLDEELYVDLLAKMVFLSSAHLSRLFKKKHGMGLNDYITGQRMKVAKEMVETTDLSISMISSCVGFSNYSYFIKLFKKTYHKTPREYRLEYKK